MPVDKMSVDEMTCHSLNERESLVIMEWGGDHKTIYSNSENILKIGMPYLIFLSQAFRIGGFQFLKWLWH
jgi:hypothetical protein